MSETEKKVKSKKPKATHFCDGIVKKTGKVCCRPISDDKITKKMGATNVYLCHLHNRTGKHASRYEFCPQNPPRSPSAEAPPPRRAPSMQSSPSVTSSPPSSPEVAQRAPEIAAGLSEIRAVEYDLKAALEKCERERGSTHGVIENLRKTLELAQETIDGYKMEAGRVPEYLAKIKHLEEVVNKAERMRAWFYEAKNRTSGNAWELKEPESAGIKFDEKFGGSGRERCRDESGHFRKCGPCRAPSGRYVRCPDRYTPAPSSSKGKSKKRAAPASSKGRAAKRARF